MIKERSVNSLNVKPVQAGMNHWTKENNKAYEISPHTPYFNMFICARKRSGKSSLINLITQKAINKRTNIWVFCATYQIDPTWKAIIDGLEKKGNVVNCFDSIFDGKVNILDEIIDTINQPDEEEEEDNQPKVKPAILTEQKMEEIKESKSRSKKKACEHLFIFDDLPAQMLRNSSVARLLKIHRHSKSSCIISSQFILDIMPSALQQLDIVIFFRGMQDEKLERLHRLLDLSIDFDKFYEIYKHCTEEPYSFMYLSVRDEVFRRKLTHEIEMN